MFQNIFVRKIKIKKLNRLKFCYLFLLKYLLCYLTIRYDYDTIGYFDKNVTRKYIVFSASSVL